MPITSWQAIVGKYLASWAFLLLALFLTFPMIITVSREPVIMVVVGVSVMSLVPALLLPIVAMFRGLMY